MDPKIRKVRGTLFIHILAGISLPMLLMLIVLSGIVLHTQLTIQGRFYEREGEKNLKELQTVLNSLPLDQILYSPSELKMKMKALKDMIDVTNMDLVNPATEESMIAEGGSSKITNRFQLENINKMLALKREGKNHLCIVDTWGQKRYGYLPIFEKTRGLILVLTTETDLTLVKSAMENSLKLLIFLAIALALLGVLMAFALSVRIVKPIRQINAACSEILAGQFGLRVRVRTGDELETLANNFNKMSEALVQRQRQAADSNPLTGLPGNKEIMAELSRRIDKHQKFIFFHIDLDQFKAYNDHCGLAKGDDVLRKTGQILTEVAQDMDLEGSFVGHQGGDDFIMILRMDRAREMAEAVCKKFDASLPEFYDKEDLERGYFVGEDSRSDDGELKRHRIMSISLAGVSNIKAEVTSYRDILANAIRVKKKAKKIPYSKYLIEEIQDENEISHWRSSEEDFFQQGNFGVPPKPETPLPDKDGGQPKNSAA